MLYHLAGLVPIHFIKVIDVCQDILKVSTLVTLTKVLSTFTIDNRVDRGAFPLLYDRERSLILRLVSGGEETFSDPGATQLILFTELPSRPRANNGDGWMVCRQVGNCRAVVPQARDVHRLRGGSSTDEFCARSREKKHWTMNIGPGFQ